MSYECRYSIGGLDFTVISPCRITFTETMLGQYASSGALTDGAVYEICPIGKGDRVLTDEARLVYSGAGCDIFRDGGNVVRRFAISEYHGTFYLYLLRASDDRTHYKMLVEGDKLDILKDSYRFINMMAVEEVLSMHRALILHSVYMNCDGKAVLLSAPSGTGKTTHSLLWQKQYGTEIVNGDRAIVKCEREGVFAYGLPYTGSSGIGLNKRLPIEAIVILKRGEKNSAAFATPAQAFRGLYTECIVNTWDEMCVTEATEILTSLIACVNTVVLRCNMETEAAAVLKKSIFKE